MSDSFPFLPDHNSLIETRYEKIQAMRDAGLNPFPAQFEPTHLAEPLLAAAEEYLDQEDKPVTLMGRAMTIRRFGKAAFFHLQDRTGRIQVYINKKALNEEDFEIYKKFLDTGDLVGVTGTLFRTKTEEITVQATSFSIVAKSARPLPEKFHGLTHKETRYRQRYVDLIVNPEVREAFQMRSKLIAEMRRFLDSEDFLEVETPMLQSMYGGAAARPFSTHHNALDMKLYMRIAPELYLKRLVVGGLHRVYEINRNFRNEGVSTRHNPEFTMLELYAAGWNAAVMMDFVETSLAEATRRATGSSVITLCDDTEFDLAQPWARITILDALKKYKGVDVNWEMTRAEVEAAAGELHIPKEIKTGVDAIIHLFEENVEEYLVQPVFITEFPKAVSPLAKSKSDEPEVADRFELYVNRMEMANGFSELNDPAEQYRRFAEQVDRRKAGDEEAVGEIDEDYVRALEYGMPPTAGLGVGIDRFVMMVTRVSSIRDVILFPLMRAEREEATAEASTEEPAEN